MPKFSCSILLLAGGRGQRMGGHDKGLMAWRGEPLIAHAARIARPLTDDLIISCNRNTERYAPYADRLVSDDTADFPGPLAGIRAGLTAARHNHLLVLPCDAPLVDGALLNELLAQAGQRPVMVRQGAHWQPLFCLLPKTIWPAIEQAWQAGERSPQRIFAALNPVAIECREDDPRLANFNTPQLLESWVADRPE